MKDIWTTFKGEKVDLNTMSHQHLSNIWYYMNVTIPEAWKDSTKSLINMWLAKRFGGEKLLYRPNKEFKQEIVLLYKKGWLHLTGSRSYDISIPHRNTNISKYAPTNYLEKIGEIKDIHLGRDYGL